jgi:hypothetical protein
VGRGDCRWSRYRGLVLNSHGKAAQTEWALTRSSRVRPVQKLEREAEGGYGSRLIRPIIRQRNRAASFHTITSMHIARRKFPEQGPHHRAIALASTALWSRTSCTARTTYKTAALLCANKRERNMADYCVNKSVQTNGDHEVHERGCTFWPLPQNVQSLGGHGSCASAVVAARRYFTQVNSCKTCSRTCHTQ